MVNQMYGGWMDSVSLRLFDSLCGKSDVWMDEWIV